jgi:hypothetical protein
MLPATPLPVPPSKGVKFGMQELEVCFVLLIALAQIGLPMIGIHQSFTLGLIVWIVLPCYCFILFGDGKTRPGFSSPMPQFSSPRNGHSRPFIRQTLSNDNPFPQIDPAFSITSTS